MKWDSIKDIRDKFAAEQGTIAKGWGNKLPVVLVYPNSYYIGMSNLGVQAIYRLLNTNPDSICERAFFDPKDDSEPLAMESQRPATDFAVIAFSINYELDYFNVVRILKAAGIPLFSKDRDETHPIIIAGGPCITSNPMPLAPFFDCLCIGEAEALFPHLIPTLKEGASEDRPELQRKLSNLPGIFVPGFSNGVVQRQWAANLDDFPVHSIVLTHDTELGGMYLIEVERGCNWGCRFCLVNQCYKPMRIHSVESILEQGKEGLKYRNKLGLVGPAVTDHPQIEEITSKLIEMGAEISVSSLRIKPLPASVLSDVIEGGTGTVALAPEAGSQRLRDVILKRINEDDILKAVEKVAHQGIKQLKLYFMIGLPTETDDDILDITRLVKKCRETMEKTQPNSRITLTISPFIPKAGTAFQREGMAPLDALNHRLETLKNNLPSRGTSIKNESVEWAEVQAVLSRGDEKLADVLASMEKVSLAQWRKALKNADLEADYYAHSKWNEEHKLPWGFIK